MATIYHSNEKHGLVQTVVCRETPTDVGFAVAVARRNDTDFVALHALHDNSVMLVDPALIQVVVA